MTTIKVPWNTTYTFKISVDPDVNLAGCDAQLDIIPALDPEPAQTEPETVYSGISTQTGAITIDPTEHTITITIPDDVTFDNFTFERGEYRWALWLTQPDAGVPGGFRYPLIDSGDFIVASAFEGRSVGVYLKLIFPYGHTVSFDLDLGATSGEFPITTGDNIYLFAAYPVSGIDIIAVTTSSFVDNKGKIDIIDGPTGKIRITIYDSATVGVFDGYTRHELEWLLYINKPGGVTYCVAGGDMIITPFAG